MNKLLPKSLSRYLAVQSKYNLNLGSNRDQIIHNINSPNFSVFLDFDKKIKYKRFDKNFFHKIFDNLVDNNDEIEKLITKNLSGGWQIDRLPSVLSAILSVAISEILLCPKTSIKIIVSEYLKIAESFHKDDEIKFINAILDNIHKELNKSA